MRTVYVTVEMFYKIQKQQQQKQKQLKECTAWVEKIMCNQIFFIPTI